MASTKNVAMATIQTYFDSAYRDLSNGASYNSVCQIELKRERDLNGLPFILAVTSSYTQIVAMATMMTHFDRAYRELSNSLG